MSVEQAEIHRGPVPDWAVKELPGLYQCPYATAEFISLQHPGIGLHLCSLRAPRHLIIFGVSGNQAEIYTAVAEIDAESISAACRAIFSNFPAVKKIVLNAQRHPLSGALASRSERCNEDIVAALPATVAEFTAALGSKTRKHLKTYRRRLETAFDDFEVRLAEGGAADETVVHEVIEMNRARMEAKGGKSGIDDAYEARLAALAKQFGFILTCRAGGRTAAGTYCSLLGEHLWLHVLAHDPEYDRYDIGQIALYETIAAAITRGVKEFHMLWGKSEYKFRFGGVERPLYRGTVYRSRWRKMLEW